MENPTVCRRCGITYDAHGYKGERRRYCSFACRIDKQNRVPAPDLTADLLRSLVIYDLTTGSFTWRERPLRPGLERIDRGWNKRLANKTVAMRLHRHGHSYTGIAYKNYAAHRLAWLYVYGEWPSGDIDHINRNPQDNRLSNLRVATPTQNLRNAKRRTDNTSGHKGVTWSKKEKKWYAYITINGKMTGLGRYQTKDEAISARKAAALENFGEFANEV